MENKLIYVWHDCFVYQGDRCMLIFDYGQNPPLSCPYPYMDMDKVINEILSTRGENFSVYFLVSHHHKDHFNREIFSYAQKLKNVRYIISKDTARSVNYLIKEGSTYSGRLKVERSQVCVLKPGESVRNDHVSVHAFGSTDIGNSYIVEVDEKILFHAGDLNAWVWKDESTVEEVEKALNDYENILKTIKARFPYIDYAMFPVDARIGRDFWEGARRFVWMLDVKYFIPMHFCLYSSDSERILYENEATIPGIYANPERGNYCAMRVPGEILRIS